jgi:D-amino-acid oxidase
VARVLVIGAGVSGLTVAACLAEAGHEARIRAAASPRETTSYAAGAMWGGVFAAPQDRVTGWAAESLAAFRELAENPDSGVRIASGTLATRGTAGPPPELFPGAETVSTEPPAGFNLAFRITVPVIDMPRYLDHMAAGIDIEIGLVDSLEDALGQAEVVFNCAGIGARQLAGDDGLRPVRGQHVIVENPGIDEFFIADPFGESWTSWFPHGNQVVLGGIAQEGDWETAPRAADAERILTACAEIEPRFADARVIEQRVGLRPARDTIRVEAERIGSGLVVHDYGHGGTGVGLSWGCAREAVTLLDRAQTP